MAPPPTETTVSFATQQDALKNMLQLFAKLKKNEQELIDTIQDLEHKFLEIDNALGEDIEQWNQHNDVFVEQVIAELAAQGINLSELEKDQLKRGLKTISEIRNEIRAQRSIDIPAQATRFRIRTISAIVAALARTLKKIDSSTVNTIVNKLNTITTESNNALSLKKIQEQIYQDLSDKVKNSGVNLMKQVGLSSEEKEVLNQAIRIVSPEKAPPPKPWIPAPIIK